MASFGERFKFLRSQKDLGQEELINDFNKKYHYSFSKSAVSQYENNKRIPEINALIDFADYFDVSLDYLMGRTDKRNENIDTENQYPEAVEFLDSFVKEMDERGYDFSSKSKEEIADLLVKLFKATDILKSN